MAIARSLLVQIKAEASDYQKKMSEAAAQTKVLSKETELYNTKMAGAGATATLLAGKLEVQKKAMSSLNAQVAEAEKFQKKLNEAYGAGSKEAERHKAKLVSLQIAQAKLNNDIMQGIAAQTKANAAIKAAPVAQKAKAPGVSGGDISGVGMGMTMAVTAPLAALAVYTSKAAINARETEDLFNSQMKTMADNARVWSEKIGNNLKINPVEIRKNVALFDSFLVNMEVGEQNALKMSKTLSVAAIDMTSRFGSALGMTSNMIARDLRSGIRGETEAIEKFGINLLVSNVNMYAWKNGIASAGKELTENQKVLARFGIIMESLKDTQNDFARTADSPANRLRSLGDQVTKTATDFGVALLPAVTKGIAIVQGFVPHVNTLIASFTALSPQGQSVALKIAGIAMAAGPVLTILPKVYAGFQTLGTILTAVASPAILGTVGAIGILAESGYLVYKNWDALKNWIPGFWETTKSAMMVGAMETLVAIDKFNNAVSPSFLKPKNAEQITQQYQDMLSKIKGEYQKTIADNAAASARLGEGLKSTFLSQIGLMDSGALAQIKIIDEKIASIKESASKLQMAIEFETDTEAAFMLETQLSKYQSLIDELSKKRVALTPIEFKMPEFNTEDYQFNIKEMLAGLKDQSEASKEAIKTTDKIRDAAQKYIDTLNKEADALANVSNMFEKLDTKQAVSIERMINRTKGYNKALVDMRDIYWNLSQRGLSEAFIENLRKTTKPEDINKLRVLVGAKDEQLRMLDEEYQKRLALSRGIAETRIGEMPVLEARTPGGNVVNINISGNVIRDENDINGIAQKMLDALRALGLTVQVAGG